MSAVFAPSMVAPTSTVPITSNLGGGYSCTVSRVGSSSREKIELRYTKSCSERSPTITLRFSKSQLKKLGWGKTQTLEEDLTACLKRLHSTGQKLLVGNGKVRTLTAAEEYAPLLDGAQVHDSKWVDFSKGPFFAQVSDKHAWSVLSKQRGNYCEKLEAERAAIENDLPAASNRSSTNFKRLNGRGLRQFHHDIEEGLGDEGGVSNDCFISMERRARRLPQGNAYIAPIGLADSLASDTTFGNDVDGHISRVGPEKEEDLVRSEFGTPTLEDESTPVTFAGEHPPLLELGRAVSPINQQDATPLDPGQILDALSRDSGPNEIGASPGEDAKQNPPQDSTLPEMLRAHNAHGKKERIPREGSVKNWQTILMMLNPSGTEWKEATDGNIPESFFQKGPPLFLEQKARAAAQPTLFERARQWFDSYKEPIFATAALAVVTCITMFSFLGRRSRASAPPSPSLSAPSLSARIDTTPKVTTEAKASPTSQFIYPDLAKFNPENMTSEYRMTLTPNILPHNSEFRTFALTNGPTWTDNALDPIARRWKDEEDLIFFTRRRGKPSGQGM